MTTNNNVAKEDNVGAVIMSFSMACLYYIEFHVIFGNLLGFNRYGINTVS